MLHFQSKDLNLFLINSLGFAEEIIAANIAEVMNLFTISDSKMFVRQ